jgi:hypothetical protein
MYIPDIMKIPATAPLFAWNCLQTSPTLSTLRDLLEALPDRELLDALRAHRGRGRDDYSIETLWGICVCRIALRHPVMDGMLEELKRNPALCRMLGIEGENDIPAKWNLSRFEEVLGRPKHLPFLRGIFDALLQHLGPVVEDLGRDVAGDATALHARRSDAKVSRKSPLPQPTGGRKEYTDEEGKVTQVYEWFGYKLHLLVDSKHEVALAYRVTSANVGDNEPIPELVDQAQGNLCDAEELAKVNEQHPGRIRTLSYDKAADTNDVHDGLQKQGISGIIQTRGLWKNDPERMLPGDDGNSNVVYDETGTVYCYDKISHPPVRHRMAFIGHEPKRGTLKYRCPAKHEGWPCPSSRRCNAGRAYGLTKRVDREIDLRRFCRVPRSTKKFERLYRRRTSVERVNARLKLFWGIDDGNIRGPERFHARVGVVMAVHAAFALLLAKAPRHEGTLSQTRLSPIALALQ